VPNIIFPPIETENQTQQTIEFEVKLDSSTMKCAVTYKALYDHFDAEYSDPLFAFMSGRSTIESIITKKIKDNHFDLDDGIIIQSSDFHLGDHDV
jgi:hypothetical protein